QHWFSDVSHLRGWSVMKTIHIRSLSFAALAVLAFAPNVAAQDKSPALLNALEVTQLARREAPGDHARLSAHFAALADRYTAEAKRHTSMSQAYVGSPSRNLVTSQSLHCKHLAELNAQSATAVLELAAYHRK